MGQENFSDRGFLFPLARTATSCYGKSGNSNGGFELDLWGMEGGMTSDMEQ